MTRLGQMLYDDGWDAGVIQGISQGKIQGISMGLTDMILDFLKDLGDVPQNLIDFICSTTDEVKLRSWGKIAGRAESLEEFYEKTGIKL